MGWSASTTPKYSNLGEIPGIRELSDEEREILEQNDPNNGLYAMKKNMKKRKDAIATSLLNDYSQTAMDVGNFIDNWAEDPDTKSPEFNPLSPTLRKDIKKQLKITKKTFVIDDVYDIVCRRELHPMMFYFGVNIDNKTNKPYVVVVRRDYWEENKSLDGSGISDYVVPDFLINHCISRYEIKDDMSPSTVRREMIKNGFIEKHEVAGL